MEVYWNFLALKSAKWKPIWKSPCWNFIIARNSVFANTRRKVVAKRLHPLKYTYTYTELDDVRKRIYQARLMVVSCFLRCLSSLGVLPKVSLQT